MYKKSFSAAITASAFYTNAMNGRAFSKFCHISMSPFTYTFKVKNILILFLRISPHITFNMAAYVVTCFTEGRKFIPDSLLMKGGFPFFFFLHSLLKEAQNNRQWWKESQEAKNVTDCIFIRDHFSLQTELTTLYASWITYVIVLS